MCTGYFCKLLYKTFVNGCIAGWDGRSIGKEGALGDLLELLEVGLLEFAASSKVICEFLVEEFGFTTLFG